MADIIPPTKAGADIFAAMIECGAPATEIVRVLCPALDKASVLVVADAWSWHPTVLAAQRALLPDGKSWTELSDVQRRDIALRRAQNQAAYLLATKHIGEVEEKTRTLLINLRDYLERVKAGTAGKGNGLEEFLKTFKAEQAAKAKKHTEAVN